MSSGNFALTLKLSDSHLLGQTKSVYWFVTKEAENLQ